MYVSVYVNVYEDVDVYVNGYDKTLFPESIMMLKLKYNPAR